MAIFLARLRLILLVGHAIYGPLCSERSYQQSSLQQRIVQVVKRFSLCFGLYHLNKIGSFGILTTLP